MAPLSLQRAEGGMAVGGLFSPLLSTPKMGRFERRLLSFGINRERSGHESAFDLGWRCVPPAFRGPREGRSRRTRADIPVKRL